MILSVWISWYKNEILELSYKKIFKVFCTICIEIVQGFSKIFFIPQRISISFESISSCNPTEWFYGKKCLNKFNDIFEHDFVKFKKSFLLLNLNAYTAVKPNHKRNLVKHSPKASGEISKKSYFRMRKRSYLASFFLSLMIIIVRKMQYKYAFIIRLCSI